MNDKINISSNFDGGNIEVINCSSAEEIELNIRKDHQSDFYQWFYFRVASTKETLHKIKILNAGSSSYPPGWKDYRAVCSYDRENWFRVDTNFNGEILEILHTPKSDSFYLSYFTPYSDERHLNLISKMQMKDACSLTTLGKTLDNRDIDMLKVGDNSQKLNVWMTARQHPGETMAEWLVEGFLERLLSSTDALSAKALQKANFYVIPNMNPDGSYRGHLRTNAKGVNLNREWKEPSLETSPEVYHTLKAMDEVGVDLFLDIHGDENLPYNFVAGSEGNPTYNTEIEKQEKIFKDAFLKATPEFQTKYGYPLSKPGEGNMTIATTAIAHRFNCMSFTLEMPFKDNKDLPDHEFGWSSERSKKLGFDILEPIVALTDYLSKKS